MRSTAMRTTVGAALALSGWVALAATALPDGSALRVAVALVFLLICPGAATVRLARPTLARHGHPLSTLEAGSLTLALSVSIATLVAETYYIDHRFTTVRALVTLAVVTSLLALAPLLQRRRDRDRNER